jgi:hypothetical protein
MDMIPKIELQKMAIMSARTSIMSTPGVKPGPLIAVTGVVLVTTPLLSMLQFGML